MHGHWLKDYIGPKASANSGGGILSVKIDEEKTQAEGVTIYDHTWQEVHDAIESGMLVVFPPTSGADTLTFDYVTVVGNNARTGHYVALASALDDPSEYLIASDANEYLHAQGGK